MDASFRLLHQIHARYPPVEARVAEILEHIRRDCNDLDLKRCNEEHRRFLFVTFFALAYVLATVTSWLMDQAFDRRADNLGSLKRIRYKT